MEHESRTVQNEDNMIFKPPKKTELDIAHMRVDDQDIEIVNETKLVGVTLDDRLMYSSHITNTQSKAYKALKAISKITNSKKNPNQEVHMRLYKTLIRPILEYGLECTIAAGHKHEKAYITPIQRKALLAATGCKVHTSNDALEKLTGTIPSDIFITYRQAHVYLRLSTKRRAIQHTTSFHMRRTTRRKNGTSVHLLRTRFNEMRGELNLNSVDKESHYDTRLPPFTVGNIMGVFIHMKTDIQSKEEGKENILEVLQDMKKKKETVTDGSALGNPGPTSCAAVIYEQWGTSELYTLRKPVAQTSNNYEGELQELHLAICTLERRKKINTLILCNCKAAIESITTTQQIKAYTDLVHAIRHKLQELRQSGQNIQIVWCPGHMEECGVRETTEHFMYNCGKYEQQRHNLRNEVEIIFEAYGIKKEARSVDIITLAGMREDLGEYVQDLLIIQ
ncbi:hypothetical protein Bbelb_139840 [Branchiostoma belcheri]|nr:hypothetical protein Bbelb_139840 [Branchiostoma belcheri]